MASWMIHLRIADALIERIPELDETAFIMGNIAPDSGVPNADWSGFTPPKTISHFYALQEDSRKKIDAAAFCAAYFSEELIRGYSAREYSFFLGYYVHLLTDIAWTEKIYDPSKEEYAEEKIGDRKAFVEKLKADWYDLDFRYLAEHPDFRAFRMYEQAGGFPNVYMKEFPAAAFDDRRAYICAFYHSDDHGELYRAYPYLTPERADRFVTETAEELCSRITQKEQPVIRKVRQGDAHTLAFIQTESWKAAFADILPEEVLRRCTEPARAEAMYARLLEGQVGNGYLLLLGDAPHCIAWWDATREQDLPGYAELICIHSLQQNWHRGYGSRMLEQVLADIRKAGFARVMLWVFEKNTRAIRFYEKHGFADSGRRQLAFGAVEAMYVKELQ